MKNLHSFFSYALFWLLLIGVYTPAAAQSNQWTWLSGSNTTNQPSTYGASVITPGGRYGSVIWTDAAGNRWLYGGQGVSTNGFAGYLSDLWKYTAATNTWTWIKGSGETSIPATYGTQSVPDLNNTPGSRRSCTNWTDNNGNLWLFGGSNATGAMNDLWKYDITTNNWTWVKGGNTYNQPGVYGIQGTAAATNTPCAKNACTGWTDASGNFWLFGGFGNSSGTS